MDSPSETDTDLQTHLRRQEVVADLAQRALDADDIDRVLDAASAAVAETLENEFAAVFQLLPAGDDAGLRHGCGWRDNLVESTVVPIEPKSHLGHTLHEEQPVIVDEGRTTQQFSAPELLASHDVVSGISVAVGPDENPWGILGTYTAEPRSFTDDDAAFLQRVASVLTSAIEDDQRQSQPQRPQQPQQSQPQRPQQPQQSQPQRPQHELEERCAHVLDAFYALDEDWTFTALDERAHELLNFEDRDLVGKTIWEAFDAASERKFKSKFEQAIDTQEPVSFEEYYPDPLGSWYEVQAYPSSTGLSVYFRDITDRKERERELELFRTLLDHSNDSVLVVDPHTGRFLDANETACRRLGYDRDELLELSAPDIEHRFADVEDWRSHVEDVTTERTVTLEGLHERKDGSTYPAEVNVTYVELDREYMIAIARDITERRRRERRLRESEQQYRTLVENFPNGIVTLFDDDLRYTLASGRAFDELPISPTDVEGQTVWDAWPDTAAETLEPAFESVLEGETQVVNLEYTDREWLVRVVPITDVDGNVFGGMTITQDITERKEHERALEESERRYRTLVEHFPNGAVGLYDEDLSYLVIGGDLLADFGVSSADVVGSTVDDRYPDELVAEVRPSFEAVFDGNSTTFETEYEGRELIGHTVPVRNADDEIYAGMLMVQDITERKEYERKLEESNERLEQFAYAASHDLQEPLRMITSYLQLIETRYGDELDEDGEEFLEFAVDGAERMREMIDGLLKYSRVDTKGDPFEPVDLTDVLDDALEDLQMKIDERDADVTSEPLPRVTGDRNQLRQVFQNLVSNSIEYSGDDQPKIHVSAEQRGEMHRLSVHDDGIGIDSDEVDRVFEVFQRLHTRDEHDGTGIGLALCQRIVERHDGEIWIESEPDEGTTVSFTLPAV